MFNNSSPFSRRISDGNTRFTLPPLNTATNGLPSLQKSTYSYALSNTILDGPNVQHEEYYYPVYNKQPHWTEDDSLLPMVENSKIKKKREMDDRITEIDREFLENREVLYGEKMKQLQEELTAVEQGNHESFDQNIADLEQKRRETIHDARLMMVYQISTVNKTCNATFKQVQDECMAEQKEIQNALYTMIEEKRRKLKEEKDERVEITMSDHQTRNNSQNHRKRVMRKRGGELEALSTSAKKRQENKNQNPAHLVGVLEHRSQEEIDQDYYEMKRRL